MANGFIDEKFLDENGKLIPQVDRFNWGAFLLSWIWGIGNKTYITLIVLAMYFIPFLNIINFPLCIWFGVKGNEWALKNKHWESVEHFDRVQRLWAKWAAIVYGAMLVLPIMGVIIALTIPSVMLNTNDLEQRTSYKKVAIMLNQAVSLEYAINENRTGMTSTPAFTRMMAEHLNAADVNGNSFTTTDGMIWVFECSNGTSCIVTVDTNGKKGPNKVTRDAEHPKDQIKFKIINNPNGTYNILNPKWLKAM